MSLFEELSGARFSPCSRYRYLLWRKWDPEKPGLVFLMLNPSTANEVENDPTVERCQRRAFEMGYGGLTVVNIFAFRSTDPGALYVETDPVGPDNDAAILEAAATGAGMLICAWGGHGLYRDRGADVLRNLRAAGVRPYCLALNKDGTPRHPLYCSYDLLPTLMD